MRQVIVFNEYLIYFANHKQMPQSFVQIWPDSEFPKGNCVDLLRRWMAQVKLLMVGCAKECKKSFAIGGVRSKGDGK